MPRLSLRELLILVAAVAIALVSLRIWSPFLQAVAGLLVLLSALAATISIILDRGPRQAFAIGVMVTIVTYVLLVFIDQKYSDPFPELPTTKLIGQLHSMLGRKLIIDATARMELSQVDPAKLPVDPNLLSSGYDTVNGRPVYTQLYPDNGYFYSVAQCWWTLLLAYFSGRFARFVYLRRIKEQFNAPEK